MKRLSVDKAPPEVKRFMRTLSIDRAGVEVTLGGNVLCKIIPPGQFSDSEKAAILKDLRQMLSQAHANSKRKPATEVEATIRSALKTIRKGR